ncbi:hypothetical protein ScPMuIL_015358 [Solemya velum]
MTIFAFLTQTLGLESGVINERFSYKVDGIESGMDFTKFVGFMASSSSIGVYLVGIEICYRIIKKGSTGDISSFPFIAYFIACCLWLRYGVLENIFAVTIVNGFGAVTQFTYICIFYMYTKRRNHFLRMLFFGCCLLLLPLVYVKYFQLDHKKAQNHFGMICVGMTIIGYAAPLASLTDVIKTKSTDCMSFPLVFVNFVVAIEWFLYGLLIKDFYLQLPNFLGFVLALMQLGLFIRYPGKKTPPPIVHTL